MGTTTRGAARQTPAARHSTKPPLKKRRASPAAPASGTADDPIKADSSSEYDDESDGEFLEPEPVPRKRGRSSADDAPPKKKKKRKADREVIYGWHELNTDITDEVRGVLDAMDPKTAALCQDAAANATYELDTDGSPLRVHTPPKFLEALYARFEEIGRDVEVKVQGRVKSNFTCPTPSTRCYRRRLNATGSRRRSLASRPSLSCSRRPSSTSCATTRSPRTTPSTA